MIRQLNICDIKLEQGIQQKAQADIAAMQSQHDIDLLRVSSENDRILRQVSDKFSQYFKKMLFAIFAVISRQWSFMG